MPVINGVYTKDFPALGRAPIDTDIIPIAELANQITYKTTIGAIFNAKVFGTTGAIPKFTSTNTLGDSIITELSDKIGVDIATPNNKLSINSTDPGSGLDLQIGATSYARFGIINPGLPGEPGIDNDCFIGSTINNDFLVRTNNIEALRIDTAQRLTIANIQNALADTDKFLVSEGGVIKYRTGAEVLADIGAGVGSVTSVGLTMPVAFSVANSPITSSGTLEVTAIGTASQYIRGDGTLATIPSTSSGGANVNYYLNGSVAASVATYKQMANSAVIGAGTDFNLTGNGLIAQFLTDAGNPNRLLIPGGAWNFEMYFNISSSGGNSKFYVELLKYNGTTFTSIASSVSVPEEITGGTTTDLYITSLAVPETVLLITDRLALRVYIVDNSGGRTVTLHTEDNTLCLVTTTFAGGIAALNGLTANTQYFAVGTTGTDFNISSVLDTHTFNLPTASATNRGALSSANWSTFNGKIGGTGTTNYIPKFNGTSSLTNSTIFEDAGGVAIGTNFSVAPFLFYVNGGIGAAGNSTITGNLTASQFIVPGGTSSQFLKANGSLDSTAYATTSSLSAYVPYTGATGAVNLGAYDLTVNGINIGLGGGAISTNTRVGTNALSANTIGSFNTSIGRISLNENTTGGSNTAIGDFALGSNTTGGLNIAQGAGAGNSNTTGSNNIFLGYNSTGESATENNRTWIGNASTTSTWLGGNLLLGSRNNATSDKLQITGGAKITGIITLGTGADSYVYDSGGSLILQTGASPRLTIAPAGAATFSSSGTENSIFIGGIAASGGYGVVSLNGTNLEGQYIGIAGGGSSGTDKALYYQSGNGGSHIFRTGNGSAFTQKMLLNSSGNLGLGVTPSAWLSGYPVIQMPQLSIFSGAGGGGILFGNAYLNTSGAFTYQNSGLAATAYNNQGGAHQWSIAPSGTAGNAISFTQAMTLTAGGNLGIGTTSPKSYYGYSILTIGNNSTGGLLSFRSAYNSGDGAEIYQASDGILKFNTNGSTNAMNITPGGNVLIGTATDSGAKLQVAGDASLSGQLYFSASSSRMSSGSTNWALNNNANTVNLLLIDNATGNSTFSSLGTGTVYSNAGTLTNTNPSDKNLKTEITDLSYGLNEIIQLRPVSYLWKNDKINQGKQFGFIAQEVQEVMPELVKEGDYLGLDKEAIFVTLINAIKELNTRIIELENK